MLEYATLLAVLVAALVGMQVYVKRGIAGKVRQASDSISEPYDPRNTEGGFVTRSSNTTVTAELVCNEPQLSGLEPCFGARICFDENRDGVCDCIDLNGKNGCTDRDVSGTVRRSDLLGEITNRSGQETVGPLGDTIWE